MNRPPKLWNISVQQIQIFLKAVELKNFTQVANHFSFTPSMISKTIASMENELDLVLFIRKPHELTPTPAALLLAKDWRQFVGSFNKSIERARSCQDEQQHKIVLGFVDSSSDVDQLIRRIIIEYMKAHPRVEITAEKHDMHRLVELLNHGMLDIVQTSDFEIPYLTEQELPWEKAFDSDVAVFVPEGNSLFHNETVDFSDLREQPIVSLDPTMHPSYANWLSSLCSRYGFVPDIRATFRTVRSLLFSLKINNYIFIGDTITSDWCDEALKRFVLPEKSFSLIAWRRNAGKELLQFKEYLKATYPQSIPSDRPGTS
ncbi:MAG: LysR family transcriptional regulator [Enterocloster sp.]